MALEGQGSKTREGKMKSLSDMSMEELMDEVNAILRGEVDDDYNRIDPTSDSHSRDEARKRQEASKSRLKEISEEIKRRNGRGLPPSLVR